MTKVFVRRSTAAFGLVIFLLLMLSIGLLVALLKGKMHHDSLKDEQTTSSISTARTRTSGGASSTTVSTTTKKPSPSTTQEPLPVWYDFRLPSYIVPLTYDLMLEPDMNRGTFNGTVSIDVNATNATDVFIVHAYKLTITDAVVVPADDSREIEIEGLFSHDPNEFFVIQLKKEVPAGRYKLNFEFRGSLTDGIVGFYRSVYKIENETRFLATSKFQPTYARRAFPCFDEPNFKSKFNITLVHEKGFMALSNMPKVKEIQDRDSGKIITKFQESVPMVTYLACFIVCDFDNRTIITNGTRIPFSVFATPNQIDKANYALEIGPKILDFYADYFNISYPLPKQDMIAIPDFVSGAMEHWGLITYREVNLLYDENESSSQNKQRVAAVIAHELAHMWFGNLVTMEWWDDLWLNEGFASYIEYKGMAHVEPGWDMKDQFLTEDLQPVMDLDSTTSSHPIVQDVRHPDEITEIFDTISYSKGASVLRMLESFLGEKIFKIGVSNFLKRHEYKNARTADLWNELTQIAETSYAQKVLPQGHNVTTIMDTWTRQMGYPVLHLERDKKDPTNIYIWQERFLRNPSSGLMEHSSSPFGYKWIVPLTYHTSMGRPGSTWIVNGKKKKIHVKDNGRDGWIKFNNDQTGYYLVNYDANDWQRLNRVLRNHPSELTPSDRSNLLYDAFQLSWAGYLDYDVLFNMTQYLREETHLIPWSTAEKSLISLGHLLDNTETRKHMQKYVRDLVEPIYRTLGWQASDDNLNNLLRTVVLNLACRNEHIGCTQEASKQLQRWISDTSYEIPADLRNLVYRYGMFHAGGSEEWNFMWDRYKNEESAQERTRLLFGLAHVRIPALLHRYLDYAMNETLVRRQDFFSVLGFIAGNPVGRHIVWNFLRFRWDDLVKRFSLNDRNLGKVVKTICDYFTSEFELREMLAFFNRNPNAGAGKRARQQAVENVMNNIAWLKKYRSPVSSWLEKNTVPDPWESIRLPKYIQPESYEVQLEPQVVEEAGQIFGTTNIEIVVNKTTDVILLHAMKMTINTTEVSNSSGTKYKIAEMFFYTPNEYYVIKLKDPLQPGTYYLHFEFVSSLLNNLKGFYRSTYTINGEKRYIATSQFQSTAARYAFPCFDEPSFKSTFNITLIHPKNMTALSNMNVKEKKEEGDKMTTVFEPSVKMVTYLVAVIVCDFKYVEGKTINGTEVRVYAREDQYEKGGYALKVGIGVLEFYERLYNMPYPLPKLDMIAIPDFYAGAMENWGLVTYRETYLIHDEAESSSRDKHGIAYVIAHELAHMWFGNLVTMKWWDDLWLNEGFATYNSYKGISAVEPAWDMADQFVAKEILPLLTMDGFSSSHPIVQTVTNPSEIAEIFDSISYNKGSTVMRMLESFIGTQAFDLGIQNYLKKYQFGSAVTKDLWNEFKGLGSWDFDISRVMDTWTRQMGYPYVTVNRSKDTPTEFHVKQKRFFLNPEDGANMTNDSPFRYIWEIPLSYSTSEKTSGTFWLNSDETKTFTVNISNPDLAWVKFNTDFKGFYLVRYPDEDYSRLEKILNTSHTDFSHSDRAQLITEAFLLASAGHLDYNTALGLTRYLRRERHYVPWVSAQKAFTFIADLLSTGAEKTEKVFLKYVQYIVEETFQDLQWNDKGDHLIKQARLVVIDLACRSGDPACRGKAKEEFQKWLDGTPIQPDLRDLTYVWGMVEIGDESIWQDMWERYQTEPSQAEKNKIMNGLTSIRDEEVLKMFLNKTLNATEIRTQDFYSVVAKIGANPKGLQPAWDFYRDNWELLVDRFGIDDRSFGNLVTSICGHFASEERLQEMQEFFDKYPDAGAGKRAREQAIQTVKYNIQWVDSYSEAIHKWVESHPPRPWENLRLPTHIYPTHYDLKLHPFMEDQFFNGSVKIDITIEKNTSTISVHIKMLNITKLSLFDRQQKLFVDIENSFLYEENEFYTIVTKSPLQPGDYSLYYEFEGHLIKDMKGFYLSTYTDAETNGTRYLATSQFEATDARKAFPCFDEPSFKATFNITLVHELQYIALSNMPVLHITNSPGYVETTFEQTVQMSTYLVAVIVCDFDFKKTTTENGVEIRVYARKDEIDKVDYSLQAAKKILPYFEKYFNVTYPMPKLDMIAIPDFSAGAMENWGLITYREARVLYDEKVSSSADQQSICRVIAHEIAHMWFGNLVTMRWWDDLWLNEGFASYIQYKGMNEAEPDWESMIQFISDTYSVFLEPDSVVTSHPIVQIVRNPNEIASLFDSISYNKGGSVLRMLENFLKEETFRKGVSNYLDKYKYQNTMTVDLWDELESASEKLEVTPIMDSWTRQMGYPVVFVERELHEDSNTTTYTITQERFLTDPESALNLPMDSPLNYIWHIPLSYKTADGVENMIWIDKKQEKFSLNHTVNGWVKFNADTMGIYFVKYDTASFENIIEALNSQEFRKNLTSADRAGLILEIFYLARSGHVNYTDAFDLSSYIKKEVDTVPWKSYRSVLSYLYSRLRSTTTINNLKKLVKKQLNDTLYNLEFEDKGKHLEKLLRTTIYDLACKSEHLKCIDDVTEAFENWKNNGVDVSPNMKDLVYFYGMRFQKNSPERSWEFMWNKYLKEPIQAERVKFLSGLGQVQDEISIRKYLNNSLIEENVRSQDVSFVFQSVAVNPKGLNLAWEFLKDQWNDIIDKFTLNSRMPGNLLKAVCKNFNRVEEELQMKMFFANHPDMGASNRARDECLEAVRNNIKWVQKYEADIQNAIKNENIK